MRSSFVRNILAAIRMMALMTVVLGVVYPLAVTAFAQTAVEDRADGSMIEVDGEVVGSRLIAQEFVSDVYLHSRPSAADYDGAASTGSNLGPTSPDLLDSVEQRVTAYRESNGLGEDVDVPVDAVTSSGSGLDPHVSSRNAQLQAARIAASRQVDVADVLQVIAAHTDHRPLGILGDDAVNVLAVNVALDGM